MTNLMQRSEKAGELFLPKDNNHGLKLNRIYSLKKKYFLLCGDCFWMSSTLAHSSDEQLTKYKKCPLCESKIDRLSIPNSY
jgi:hypothetical protein